MSEDSNSKSDGGDAMSRASRAVSGSRMMHGGWAAAKALLPATRDQLDVLIDTLIPPEDGWPRSATLRVAETIERYLVPDDGQLSLYPHFRRSEFIELLGRMRLRRGELHMGVNETRVAEYEKSDAQGFARLRDFAYFAYYGTPAVVAEVRSRTRYGGDFHGATQPAGYDDSAESWGNRTFTTRGAFISTDAVIRSLSKREKADGH